jgi:hypothetical protein
MTANSVRKAIMNEATPGLDDSHATSTSTENKPSAAEYDVSVAVDAVPRAYKALPKRPTRPDFMDFFAPRRREPIDQAVPRYTALAEPPTETDLSETVAEIPATPEILEASTDQSTEQTFSNGKALTEPVAAERTHHGAD